jgi:hypothetical protein
LRHLQPSSLSPNVDDGNQVTFRWGVRYEAPKRDEKVTVTWQVGGNLRPGDEINKELEHLLGEDKDEHAVAIVRLYSGPGPASGACLLLNDTACLSQRLELTRSQVRNSQQAPRF